MRIPLAIFVILGLTLSAAGAVAGAPAQWIDVPYVAQVKNGCGAAVISMVMQYWQTRLGETAPGAAEPERIQAAVASRPDGEIAASAMQSYFHASGYRAFEFRANWSDLQHHLEAGRPLIVSLKASGRLGPLHYVVVVGIDAERGFLFLNDPAAQKLLRISREGFESEWGPTNNWALLVVPQPAN